MSNIVTKEMLEHSVVPEEVFDKIEEYKSAIQWMEMFKFELAKVMKENGIKKFEADDYIFSFIDETIQRRTDTERMKNESVYVVNAETGELDEVNAYDYFVKNVTVKEHMSVREKK